MHLDGYFAGSEIGGYLFVKHSRHDHPHNFPLPRSQRLVTASQVNKMRLRLANRGVSNQSLLNGGQQVPVVKRFRQEFQRAGFHSSYRHWNITVAGNKDDGDLSRGIPHFLLKVETADSRKRYIQDETTRATRTILLEKLFRCFEAFGPQTSRFQQPLYRCTYIGVIIDDEYRG